MEITAGLIRTSEFRKAMVRLCRLACEPLPDGRLQLQDWENSHRHPADKALQSVKDTLGTSSRKITITSEQIASDPLLWLQALDEHCAVHYPDSVYAINNPLYDGDGHNAWLLPIQSPGSRSGAHDQQFGNLRKWLRHHRYVPARSNTGVPLLIDSARGHAAWIGTQIPPGKPTTIGIVHFDDGVQLRTEEDVGAGTFSCTGLDLPDERLNRAKQLIEEAKGANIQILVFPELTLPLEARIAIQEHLRDEFESESKSETSTHRFSVPIIVLGSFHACESGKWRNRARMVCGLDGTELLICDKRSGVTIPPGLRERIDAAPTPLSALHIDTLGLIAVAICKDFFDGQIASALPAIEPDWLLVPSMSNALTPHAAEAKKLHDRLGTVIAVANQEMPGHQDAKRGFIWHKTRHDSDQSLMSRTIPVQAQTNQSAKVLPFSSARRP